MRAALCLLLTVAVAPRASACTFCPGDVRARPTLGMQFAAAHTVVVGTLKSPRVDPKTDEGFTDLHVGAALKGDAPKALTLRAYLPVVGETPAEYVAFCTSANGKLDATFGTSATPALVEYLRGSAKLSATDRTARLAYFFKHLASADTTVAADAFVEFARASDADIAAAAKHFDPAALRKLLADDKTPGERVGVFAYLLGVSGGADDAQFLARLLAQDPLPERVRESFGGLLAGYVLLAPADGWALAARVLGNDKQPFAVLLGTLQTVRFFQATQRDKCKPQVLKCCAALLPNGDLADQAIEDLRRWGYWDLSADVFALFGKPSHSAPIVRRCVVRYALTCPTAEAKAFAARAREADPKLVATVEEQLKQFEKK